MRSSESIKKRLKIHFTPEAIAQAKKTEVKNQAAAKSIEQYESIRANKLLDQGLSRELVYKSKKKNIADAKLARLQMNELKRLALLNDTVGNDIFLAIEHRLYFFIIKRILTERLFPLVETEEKTPAFDVNAVNEEGYTLLQYVILFERAPDQIVELLKLFLEHGANPEIEFVDSNGEHKSLVTLATEQQVHPEVMQFLLSAFPLQCSAQHNLQLRAYLPSIFYLMIDDLSLLNTLPIEIFYKKFPKKFFNIFNTSYEIAGSVYQKKLNRIFSHLVKKLSAFPDALNNALYHTLIYNCRPTFINYIILKGADPKAPISFQLFKDSKVYNENVFLAALLKAKYFSLHYFLECFPLVCLSSGGNKFSVQVEKFISYNNELKLPEKAKLVKRIAEIENCLTDLEHSIHHNLPMFLKLIKQARLVGVDSSYYEDIINLIKAAGVLTEDVQVKDQLHFSEGALFYQKYISNKQRYLESALKPLAAAFIAWGGIEDEKNITPPDCLFMANLLREEKDLDVPLCLPYTDHYQRLTKAHRYLNVGQGIQLEIEEKGVSQTYAELARIGWDQLNQQLWLFLRYLVNQNTFGMQGNAEFRLYVQLIDYKLKAEKNSEKRVQYLSYMAHELTELTRFFTKKAWFGKFTLTLDLSMREIIKELGRSLEVINVRMFSEKSFDVAASL